MQINTPSQMRKERMSSQQRVLVLNRYYRITKFYKFLRDMTIKGAIALLLLLAVYLVVDYFLLDTDAIFKSFVENYSSSLLGSVFYLSESSFGFMPPELLIAWSIKSPHPWVMTFLFALISYAGGITAYTIGRAFNRLPIVHRKVHGKLAQHIKNLRSWGGLFIFIGAVLPPPLSLISMASGFVKFKFSHYLLWASFRFLRFLIYYLVFAHVL